MAIKITNYKGRGNMGTGGERGVRKVVQQWRLAAEVVQRCYWPARVPKGLANLPEHIIHLPCQPLLAAASDIARA